MGGSSDNGARSLRRRVGGARIAWLPDFLHRDHFDVPGAWPGYDTLSCPHGPAYSRPRRTAPARKVRVLIDPLIEHFGNRSCPSFSSGGQSRAAVSASESGHHPFLMPGSKTASNGLRPLAHAVLRSGKRRGTVLRGLFCPDKPYCQRRTRGASGDNVPRTLRSR